MKNRFNTNVLYENEKITVYKEIDKLNNDTYFKYHYNNSCHYRKIDIDTALAIYNAMAQVVKNFKMKNVC